MAKRKQYTKLFLWQEKVKNKDEKCESCGDGRLLTVDHIVPVWVLKNFDVKADVMKSYIYDCEDNFRILCRSCNQEKSGKLDVKNFKTYLILEKLIKEAKDFYIK